MTYAVALAAASTLALAGCNGGDDEPTESSTPTSSTSESTSATTSASPTSSATPSPSTSVSIPAAAKANTEAGAIAFTKFYFESLNSAYRNPDQSAVSRVSSISGSACKSCVALTDDMLALQKAGHYVESDSFGELGDVDAEQVTEGEFRITFDLEQLSAKVLDKTGKVVDNQEAKSRRQLASVKWEGQQWRMDGLAAA